MRWRSLPRLVRLLLVAVLLAVVVRTFIAVPRRVPSGSMMPALMPGDVVLALRWPIGVPLARRALPRRGDIVIARGSDGEVVKRVLGLPGDHVAVRAGVVILNDAPIARFRVADYVAPEVAVGGCAATDIVASRGRRLCRVRRYREQLPDRRDWDTLDLGRTAGDDMPARVVPPHRLFLLGDNRDRSGDSRFAPGPGGLGFVDVAAVGGTVRLILWSFTDTARLADPGGWWQATRRDRIGRTLSRR